jgi:site-specific recombinase XerD
LTARGRGSYTQRSYGQGAADFARWLVDRGVGLDEVGRATVVEYVAEFRRGDGRGSGRAPRTVNHRVSVLVALFEYWARVDPPAVGGARGAAAGGGGGDGGFAWDAGS